MNKEEFYRYDFYTLEQKNKEAEFIRTLDQEPFLSTVLEVFIRKVIDLLYLLIKENRSVENHELIFPQMQIDVAFKNLLTENPIYDIYSKSNPDKKLFEGVCYKFISRLFEDDRFNDEEYTIQNYLHIWIEKQLATKVIEDQRFNSVGKLLALIKKTELLDEFYRHLVENIPTIWIQNNSLDWISVNVNPDNILQIFPYTDKEYFNKFNNLTTPKEGKNLWSFTNEITRGSDLLLLNEEFSFKSYVLSKKDISLWVEFWDNLKLPIIQDCVFHSFSTPEQYLEITREVISKKKELKSNTKILLLIIAKNFFEKSYTLTQRLSFYEEKDIKNNKNENLINEGKEYNKKWQIEKLDYYRRIIKYLQTQLIYTDIEDWIFSYKPKVSNHSNKFNDIYNSEVGLLRDLYKSIYDFPTELSFEIKSFNLQKFNFYVEIIRDKKDNYLATTLFDTLITFIESNEFYWDKSLSEPYWTSLKGIGYLINLQIDAIQKAKELINKFKVNHQGWKPTQIDFKPLTRETFIYSGIALLFEHEDAFEDSLYKDDFFKYFLNIILIQNRYLSFANSDYYQIPLYLLFLVANQIFPDIKDYYEQELIENQDDLYSVLSILSSSEGLPVSSKAKKLLEKRIDEEFLVEKRLYRNRNQQEKAQELEKMIELLELNTN